MSRSHSLHPASRAEIYNHGSRPSRGGEVSGMQAASAVDPCDPVWQKVQAGAASYEEAAGQVEVGIEVAELALRVGRETEDPLLSRIGVAILRLLELSQEAPETA